MSTYAPELLTSVKNIPTFAKEVYDVSGAGDTVIVTITLAITAKMNLLESLKLANIAAGIQVSKLGTSIVKPREIRDYLEHHGLSL